MLAVDKKKFFNCGHLCTCVHRMEIRFGKGKKEKIVRLFAYCQYYLQLHGRQRCLQTVRLDEDVTWLVTDEGAVSASVGLFAEAEGNRIRTYGAWSTPGMIDY